MVHKAYLSKSKLRRRGRTGGRSSEGYPSQQNALRNNHNNLHDSSSAASWVKPLRQLDELGWVPDNATYASLIRWCAQKKALRDGLRLHAHMVANRRDSNTYLANLLLAMYGQCGCLQDALRVFDNLGRPNVFSWTSIISVFAHHGLPSQALSLFTRMETEGVIQPNKFTFFPLLSSCAHLQDIPQGRKLHARIAQLGLDSDVAIRTALVKMHGKFGSIQDAVAVFHKMQKRDIVLWNAMIAAYSQNGFGKEALHLFKQLHLERLQPDKITFLGTLQACANLGDLEIGQTMHRRIIAYGFDSDIAIKNALLHMYSKCGSLKDAQAVFYSMYKRDVISWTTMITAHIQNGCEIEALELFKQMTLEGVNPNRVTFLSILDGCAKVRSLEFAREIHQVVFRSSFGSDIAVTTALVNMYGKCGSPRDARMVFDRIPDRDVILWTAMMVAYSQNNHGKEALELFKQMDLEGIKPNRVTFLAALEACASLPSIMRGREIHKLIIANQYDSDMAVRNSLVNMYGKCGSLRDAQMVFHEMPERDVISWTAMLAAYVQNGHYKEALEVFWQMDLEGIEPNAITFVNALDACASLTSLENGKAIHQGVVASGFDSDVIVRNALVNMYGKCGSLRDARLIFDKMNARDVISWNTMIAAYAQNGYGFDALEIFKQMEVEDVKPDKVTFVHILDACNQTRLFDQGCRYFVCMISLYEIEPMEMHYTCMSHLLGQAGCLEEAESVVTNMPIQSSTVSWMTLLHACRIHGDVERGARAAENVSESSPESISPFVLLSSAYATGGRWDDATNLRNFSY